MVTKFKIPRARLGFQHSYERKNSERRSKISTSTPPELTPESITVNAHEREIKRWKPPELIPEKIVKADRRTINRKIKNTNARELIPETITIVKKQPGITANNLPGADSDNVNIPSLSESDVEQKISRPKKHKNHERSIALGHNIKRKPGINPIAASITDEEHQISERKVGNKRYKNENENDNRSGHSKKSKRVSGRQSKGFDKQSDFKKAISVSEMNDNSLVERNRNIGDVFDHVKNKTEKDKHRDIFRSRKKISELNSETKRNKARGPSSSHNLVTAARENEEYYSDSEGDSDNEGSAEGSGTDGVNVDEINASISINETQLGDAGGK